MPLQPTPPAPEFRRFEAHTVDEARAMYGEYGQKVTVQDARIREPFTCTIAVAQLGPLQLSRHTIAAGLVIRIDRDDLYGIGVSPTGNVTVDRPAGGVTTSDVWAVTTDPRSGPMLVRPRPGSRLDSVVIEQWAVESHLEGLLGHPVRKGIPFAGSADLSCGAGHSLARLIRLLIGEMNDRDSVLRQPVVAASLSHALLSALLFAVGHPYRDDLCQPAAGRIGRRPARRAIDAIHAHPEDAHTTTSLARLAGVSARTLQDAFRQQLGQTPMEYLRQVRLSRVHDDLTSAAATTVSEAAHRWGFIHLGRFSAAYTAKYGTPPSATLRAARM